MASGTTTDSHSPQVQQSLSARSVLNSVAAGYAAGVAGTVIGHPLDSLKVWMQTGTSKIGANSSSSSAQHHGASGSSSQLLQLKAPHQQHQRGHHTSTKTSAGSTSTTSSSSASRKITIIHGSNSSSKAAAAHQARQSSTLVSPSSSSSLATSSTRAASSMLSSHVPPFRRCASHLRALYAGVAGPLVTVGAVQSINFALYDGVRRLLHKDPHTHYLTHDELSNVAVASMTAGACLAVLTNPLLLVKTQQQTAAQPLTYRQAVLETIQYKNQRKLPRLGNLYAGFVPHALTEIAGRGIYFVSYESLKRHLAARNHDSGSGSGSKLSLADRMLAAGLSGVITWSAIFPLDAVRCRMFAAASGSSKQQQQRNHSHHSRSSVAMASQMLRQSGWRAFYRGFGVTLLRAGPVASCVLPIYDLALDRLSSH